LQDDPKSVELCLTGLASKSTNMDREVFRDHLIRASARCREFATQFVVDSLPSTYVFWVLLNCSYDRNPLRDGEIAFPDDVREHGERVGPLTADAVVSLLWRDGGVPEWIDVIPWEVDEHATYFELHCCGRFTAECHLLYYNWTDVPPFGVKGPANPTRLAISAAKGDLVEKFSLAESRQSRLRSRSGGMRE
jgi:hypothetical protein